MITRRQMCVAMAALPLPWPSLAQQFPSRPLTFLVPFGPAAGADMLARSLAQGMARHIGQTPIVDNRPGGNGFIGTQAVLRHQARPHRARHLELPRTEQVALPQSAIRPGERLHAGCVTVQWHARADRERQVEFSERSRACRFRSEKSRQGDSRRQQQCHSTRCCVVPAGSRHPVARGAIQGVRSGCDRSNRRADRCTVSSGRARVPAHQERRPAGSWRDGKEAHGKSPDVPTLQESGIAYDFTFWYGAWVKAGTPPAVIQSLRDALLRALDEPEAKKFLASNDFEPLRMSREDFGSFQEQDLDRWATVMKKAGIQPE